MRAGGYIMKVKISMDRNGNKIVSIPGNEAGRGFSIQTNGRLPSLHRLGLGSHWLTIPQEEELALVVEGTNQRQQNVFDAGRN